jgi:hypothetical protein
MVVRRQRGGTMISSPCKNCYKKDYPKDECLKDCRMLQELQDIQIAKAESTAYTAIDYSEDNRFSIVLPLAGVPSAI